MEDDLKEKKGKKGNRPQRLSCIPRKFRGKPFLGLAQLSKIFFNIIILKNI